MLQKLVSTDNSYAGSFLRLMLGVVLFPHGAQKMLGLFGGYGFSGTMDFFTGTAGLPWIIGFLVIIIEFFGPLFLIAGLAVRITALAVIADMVGIIFKSHIENGFFMNWFGNQAGEGYEYHLLVIAIAGALLLNGAGRYSLDYAMYSGKK